ncbi:hypothetical protein BpHYR1_004845 [Brachionus plicatilis]|uniref:Secreted protein n=1 Tax=Brachionus plicatilis TaxID=10195 RepID=A0A3M7P655_BRAPC|nr:hypothetical protein BpHYR1_004845 [Brachionus plicatilis]
MRRLLLQILEVLFALFSDTDRARVTDCMNSNRKHINSLVRTYFNLLLHVVIKQELMMTILSIKKDKR